MEAHEELLSDRQCKDLSPQSVAEDIFIHNTDCKVWDEAKSVEGLSPTPLLESNISNQNYQKGPKASSERNSACETTTESEVRSLTKNAVLESYDLLIIGQYK
jgi:hypothetical protein